MMWVAGEESSPLATRVGLVVREGEKPVGEVEVEGLVALNPA